MTPTVWFVNSTTLGLSNAGAAHYGLGDMHQSPTNHRYMVQISETTLLHRGGARSFTDVLQATDGGVCYGGTSGASTSGASSGCACGRATGHGSYLHGPETSRRKSDQYFRFDCELGDIWTTNNTAYDRITKRSDKQASTGNTSVDKVRSRFLYSCIR